MIDGLDFDKASHTYRVGGRVLPSVTQCTDIMNDYSGVPAGVLEKARKRGEDVHLATELYDKGELDWSTVTDEIYPYLYAYIQFLQDSGFEPQEIEQQCYSKKLGVAGTLDRTGVFHKPKGLPDALAKALTGTKAGQKCQIDLKATYELMPGTGPQTAGYELIYNEGRKSGKLTRRYALHLCPRFTVPYRLHSYNRPEHKIHFAVFQAALTIKKWEISNV